MRNLKIYSDDVLAFHKLVVDRKRNPKDDEQYKVRLASYYPRVELQFERYDRNYDDKSLESVTGIELTAKEKTDMLGLYAYKSKTIQELKIHLTTTESNRIINTCQNCTIGEVNSLDHILPKEAFAEFSVHPKNLFPSCTKCNSYKTNSWLEGNKRIFLNLFCDELPATQYLFVNTEFIGNNIQVSFNVDNRFGINPEMFRLIESHYRRLHLCQRFAENASEVITAFANAIIPYSKLLSYDALIETAKEKIEKDRAAFGYNYWKSLLELNLIKSTDYLNMILKS